MVKDYIQRHSSLVEDFLNGEVASRIRQKAPSVLSEPMLYSLQAGGKRLRPVLCLAAAGFDLRENSGSTGADSPGVDREVLLRRVLFAAASLEAIHTYSLIHDDLPAMDNDDYRRGRPSCHRAHSEWGAILAGDALNTFAFDLLVSGVEGESDARKVASLFRILADSAGIGGMVSGQALDLACEKQENGKGAPGVEGRTLLEEIHRKKTGALIRASLRTGALLGGVVDDTDYDSYGEDLGLLFQITDDILDVEGDPAILGKSAGKDEASGKLTYPALYGLDESKTMADGIAVRLAEKGKDLRLSAGAPEGVRVFFQKLPAYIRNRTH